MVIILFFFFFQAEDGIRYIGVTGVQTCALPICTDPRRRWIDAGDHRPGGDERVGGRGGAAGGVATAPPRRHVRLHGQRLGRGRAGRRRPRAAARREQAPACGAAVARPCRRTGGQLAGAGVRAMRSSGRRGLALTACLIVLAAPLPMASAAPVSPQTYVDTSFSDEILAAPTRTENQSKIWFHDNAWW